MKEDLIHPLTLPPLLLKDAVMLKPIPAVIGREARYTLDGSLVYHTQPFTPMGKLEPPVNLTACIWTVGGR